MHSTLYIAGLGRIEGSQAGRQTMCAGMAGGRQAGRQSVNAAATFAPPPNCKLSAKVPVLMHIVQ